MGKNNMAAAMLSLFLLIGAAAPLAIVSSPFDDTQPNALAQGSEANRQMDWMGDSSSETDTVPAERKAMIGSGLVIWIGDAPGEAIPASSRGNSAYLLHDTDILWLLNRLWCAGAEAISVGGVRVGAMDGIRCGGPVILVGKAAVAPPVLILALGDAEKMQAALEGEEAPLSRWKQNGMLFSVAHGENLVIPAGR